MSLSEDDKIYMQSLWLKWNQKYWGLKGNHSIVNENRHE